MDILLVNNQENPASSGVASHFFSIGKQLKNFGHNVTRLTSKDGVFRREKDGIVYRYFKYAKGVPDSSSIKRKLRVKNNREFFIDSLQKIDCKSINLVIVANDHYVPLLKKYIKTKKIIVIIPSSLGFSREANPEGHKKIILRMKKNLLDVKTVVLSGKMKDMLRKFLGKEYDITSIPPGVELEKFSKRKKIIKTDVLYIGRMAEEKNVKDLITAISLVKRRANIKLVGAGKELSNIEKLAKEILKEKKFYFLGQKKKVERYYTESKIFVLPSKREAFGLVILEAMAANLPVIAFRPNKDFITASDEVISDGLDGFLVKNVNEMAEKIELLLENEKLRSEMGENALNKAKRFSWAEHTNKLLELAKN